MLKFYCYPRCTTCRRAKKWLDEQSLEYEEFHIVDNPPTRAQIKKFYEQSGLELRQLFNSRGKKYRDLKLKDVVRTASEDELLDLLASDGMLLKRPLVTDGNNVAVGFKVEQYEQLWK